MKRSDHHLIQQVLDGSISPSAFAGFQKRMRAESGLAKLYGEYALLNHTLCEEFEGQKWAGESLSITNHRRSWFYPILALAAAIVVLAVVVGRNFTGQPHVFRSLGKATFSADALWSVDGVYRSAGNTVGLGAGSTLHIQQGQASIGLGSSATALIEGPATLTVISEKSLNLEEGRGRFLMVSHNGGLKITTPSLTAVDLGTEFGIEVHRGGADELHVIDGKVRMNLNGNLQESVLSAGEAARGSSAGAIEMIPLDEKRFRKELGQFESVLSGPFVKADWKMEYGSPLVSEAGMDGENYSAFTQFPKPEPGDGNSVLLATLEVGKPATGEFHTDGWAGMSFFSKGAEVLFFGDAFGSERTWSLDVKQRIPVIIPGKPVLGPRTVTFCYHQKTGDASLHEGGLPLGKAFCSGKLPSGLEFDKIRLGASFGAALNVRSLTIRVGGDR
ncbi:MAG: hypothetical protein ABI600_08410 [Luteolibacter sp.]